MDKSKHINCFECLYFKVTYFPEFPRSCLLLGFKGKQLPSIIYFQTVGKNCEHFKKKEKK